MARFLITLLRSSKQNCDCAFYTMYCRMCVCHMFNKVLTYLLTCLAYLYGINIIRSKKLHKNLFITKSRDCVY